MSGQPNCCAFFLVPQPAPLSRKFLVVACRNDGARVHITAFLWLFLSPAGQWGSCVLAASTSSCFAVLFAGTSPLSWALKVTAWTGDISPPPRWGLGQLPAPKVTLKRADSPPGTPSVVAEGRRVGAETMAANQRCPDLLALVSGDGHRPRTAVPERHVGSSPSCREVHATTCWVVGGSPGSVRGQCRQDTLQRFLQEGDGPGRAGRLRTGCPGPF